MPLVFMLAHDGQYSILLWVFFSAAVTDALDGWLARRWKVESKLGQALDPLADKVLLTATFLALSIEGYIPWWLTAVVIGRDIAILCGALVLWKIGRRTSFPPSAWGKISTIVQMGFVVIVVWRHGDAVLWTEWLVVALAAISGGDYARRLFPQPAV